MKPIAEFDGYMGGLAVIKFTGETRLAAGDKLYALPVLDRAPVVAGRIFGQRPASSDDNRIACSSCGLTMAQSRALAATQPAAAPADDASELEFNATRLRNVARLVGLESAIPQDDATLDGARGSVLGLIAGTLRNRAAAPVAAQGEREAIPTWQEHYAALCKITTKPASDVIAERRKSACRDREIRELRAALAAQMQPVATQGHPIAADPAVIAIVQEKLRAAGCKPSQVPPGAVPEGFVLVPKEPTDSIVRATASCLNDEQCDCKWQVYNEDGTVRCQPCVDQAAEQYRMALAAAPSPQPASQAGGALDAARYRWLRNKADFVRGDAPQVVITDFAGEPVSPYPSAYPEGAALDAAIDAVMAQQADGGGA